MTDSNITYLSGGEQTTINATITELFPALAFNVGVSPSTPTEMEAFVNGLDLSTGRAKETFVNRSNITSAEGYIRDMVRIRPSTRNTKLTNSIAILNWIRGYNAQRTISKVVWGYRQKPAGVPDNHSGDIFLIFEDQTVNPKVIGISLKAGTAGSKEPKLNSYVGTTFRKRMWQRAYPNALTQLKSELWDEVYSRIPGLSNRVTAQNYLTMTPNRQIPNTELKDRILDLFESDPLMFDALYVRMNTICRNKLISMINGNLNATKQWIEQEFRLERRNVEVPMILVKAIRGGAQSRSDDPLRDFLPAVTSVNAYLSSGSVQEWFIDLMANGHSTMTLTMTIRSDSEYRRAKQKGKLGAFTMLKLLYRS
tara:strand:+ start:937 stop:2037 length:1101 start_codon:yes stop_codon:yes gene_type:complete